MPTSLHTSLLAAGSVLDLDGTFLIQWGIFLVFFLILRSLVWKPFLELLTRRDQEIHGRKTQAEEAEANARKREEAYQEQLRIAQNQASERRAELLEKAQHEGASLLGAQRAEATKKLEEARKDIEAQSEQARSKMRSEAKEIAHLVCERILGRKVTS